ncbi:MAG: DUF3198 domain-containing protein [Candidatus Thermoplasmatota archaeon]|jgi:hypothetical protein|nr:DUF3198 domain-containing protein [Candidatus Thermoplasmatota archaeon]MCL5785230.1 DUF3198 domain-containing protein [Candidatus Thermoplasmatota archaeon]
MFDKIKEFQFPIYLTVACVSAVFFIVSFNDEVIHNQTLIQDSLTLSSLGDWVYWIFALSFVLAAVFAYETYAVLRDTKSFYRLIRSDSKQNFVKNIKELNRISKKLGGTFREDLDSAKERWNVR